MAETGNDAIRVVECLGMAIDSADAVVSGFERTFLYCDIFNRTTTLFELGCNEVKLNQRIGLEFELYGTDNSPYRVLHFSVLLGSKQGGWSAACN